MDPLNKVGLVTGAAQGLGLAITKELLKNGVKGVSVCDINESKGQKEVEQLQQEFGAERVVFIKTDVSKEDELKDAFKQTVAKFGGLDIVVNNAGLVNDKMWQQCVLTNVNGVLLGTMLGMEHMGTDKGGKGGVIVNMSSLAGLGAGLDVMPVYNATKHAVIGLSRSFGSEFFWRSTGVRVTVICPGFTDNEVPEDENSHKSVTLQDEWMSEVWRVLQPHMPQKAEHVGKGVVQMIREAPNASIWVSSSGNPIFQVKIPNFEDMKV